MSPVQGLQRSPARVPNVRTALLIVQGDRSATGPERQVHVAALERGLAAWVDVAIGTGRNRSTAHGTFDAKQLGIAFAMERVLLSIITDGVRKGGGVINRFMTTHTPEAFGMIFLIQC